MPQRNSRRRKSSVHRQRDRFNANDAMWGGSPPPQAPPLQSEKSMPYYNGDVKDGKPVDVWGGKPPGRYGYGKKSAKKSKKSKKTKKSKKKSTKRSKKRSNRR